MGHNIQGFIARDEGLRKESGVLPGSRVIPLSLGFGFLPVNEQLCGDNDPVPFEHMLRLSAQLGAWAESVSANFPVAYIETDYFGGIGCQSALAWVGEKMVFGPVQTSSSWVDGKYVSTPLLDKAINQALRLIGVVRGLVLDEFDALGLDRHRSNESWLSDFSIPR